MSFNRSDFGLEAVITKKAERRNENSIFPNAKREKSFKTFIIYYPLCYELINQFQDASSDESMNLDGILLSSDMHL